MIQRIKINYDVATPPLAVGFNITISLNPPVIHIHFKDVDNNNIGVAMITVGEERGIANDRPQFYLKFDDLQEHAEHIGLVRAKTFLEFLWFVRNLIKGKLESKIKCLDVNPKIQEQHLQVHLRAKKSKPKEKTIFYGVTEPHGGIMKVTKYQTQEQAEQYFATKTKYLRNAERFTVCKMEVIEKAKHKTKVGGGE